MKRLVPVLVLLAVLPSRAGAQLATGSEFRVNTYTTSIQSLPRVASDQNGGFVVVWDSDNQDGSNTGVFGQRFNASGTAQGAEFRVNTYTTSLQYFPAVASAPNGNFVVVWEGRYQDGDLTAILGQRFSSAGAPLGTEFRINSYTTGFQLNPAVASDANGNFIVVWHTFGVDGSLASVAGQRFNAAGVPQGAEFRVNTFTPSVQYRAAVASDPSGNFMVVWQSYGQDATITSGVFGQRFSAAGVVQGGEFRVNAYTSGHQRNPSIAADAAGNFIVAWQGALQDGGGDGIFGQRYDANGVAIGSEFQVNSYTTNNQGSPSVVADEIGNFAVVWRSNGQDGSNYGIFGQLFDATGAPQASEFRVNSYTTGYQSYASAASSPDGDFVVVWGSATQDGSSAGVFGQRYSDLIFKDGFEGTGLSRWSSASTDGGNLSAGGAGAMAGTGTGLVALVNDTNSLFVQDDTPNAENRYRARFYLDPNGFDPGEASSHFRTRLLIAQGSGVRLITVVLKRQLGAYSLEIRVRRNDGTRADTGFFPIADGPHFVELDWQRATASGAGDGSLEMWIDGVSIATLGGIDNDSTPVDLVRLGALSVKTGAAGTLYYDQFESRRQLVIGPE